MDLGALQVSFAVNLDSLTSGISQAKQVMLGFGSATNDAASQVSSASSDMAASVGGVGDAAEEASGGFLSGIGSMVGGLLDFGSQLGLTIFSVQSLFQAATSLASGLLGPAAAAEQMSTAFTTLLGSGQAATQMMQQLDQFAAKTPFATMDIDKAASQLIGFGANAKDVIPDLTAIGDALSAVGRGSAANLDSVVNIFGKVQTQGHLSAETMQELADNGINAWAILEQQTGKTKDQLQTMISAGLFPAKDAIADLTKGIEANPLYAGGMAKQSGTLTGLLSTLKSNWDQLMASFGTPIIKELEGGLGDIGNLLSSPGFKQFAGSVGQGVATAFSDIGGAAHYVQEVLGSLNLTGFSQAWKDLQTAVAPLGNVFDHLGSLFSTVGTDADPLADIINKIAGAGLDTATNLIQGLATSLQGLSNNKAVSGFLSSLSSGFGQVSQIVGGTLSQNFKTFSNTASQLGGWFQSTMLPAIEQAMPGFQKLGNVLFTDVAPAIAKVWSIGQGLARDVMPIFIEGFEHVAPILVKVGGFLAGQLAGAIQNITPDITSAAQAIGNFAEGIIVRVLPIIEGLWSGIQAGLDWIKPYWPAIWGGIQATFGAVWSGIKGVVQVAWSIVSGIINVGLDLLSGNWKGVWNDIKSSLSGVWSGLVSIVQGGAALLWQPIKNGINSIITGIDQFIGYLDGIHISIPAINFGPVHTDATSIGLNIPKIPYLSTGGQVGSGLFVAGDVGGSGGELVDAPGGATVYNRSTTAAILGGQRQPIHIHVHIGGREVSEAIVDDVGNAMVGISRSTGPIGRIV